MGMLEQLSIIRGAELYYQESEPGRKNSTVVAVAGTDKLYNAYRVEQRYKRERNAKRNRFHVVAIETLFQRETHPDIYTAFEKGRVIVEQKRKK